MKNEKNTTDNLATLFIDKANASKNASLIAGIKDPTIRDAFANLIEAKASDGATRDLIVELARYDAEKLAKLIAVLPLSNASALRQSLEKGFDLPKTARASAGSFGF